MTLIRKPTKGFETGARMHKTILGLLFVLGTSSALSCEIYRGDLELDFACLKKEVKELTLIIERIPSQEQEVKVLASSKDIVELESDKTKVIQ